MRRDPYWAAVGLCVLCSIFWNDLTPNRAGERGTTPPVVQLVSGNGPATFSAVGAEAPEPSDLAEAGSFPGARRAGPESLRERLWARREALREWRDRSRETMRNDSQRSSAPVGERGAELRKRLEDIVQQLRQRIAGSSPAPRAEGLGMPEERFPPTFQAAPGAGKSDAPQTAKPDPSNQSAPMGPELVIPGTAPVIQSARLADGSGPSKPEQSAAGSQIPDKPVAAQPTGQVKQSEPAAMANSEEKAESRSAPQSGLGGWFTGMSQLFGKPTLSSTGNGKVNPGSSDQKAQAEPENRRESSAARPLEKRSLADIRRQILTQQQGGREK